MCSVRPIVVVEALPLGQLLLEIHVVAIREQLVELGLVRSVGALDLPVELGRAWLDVDVLHAEVRDVPVEERLELVTAVRPDGADPKGELLHHIVDEVDGVGLGVAAVDLQGPYTRGIVDRRVLVTAYRCPLLSLQSQELDVYLDVVAGFSLFVAVGVYGPSSDALGQSAQPVTPADAVDRRIGGLEVVIPL